MYFTMDCRVPADAADFIAHGALLVCEGPLKLQTFRNHHQPVRSFCSYAQGLKVISEHIHYVCLLKGMQDPAKWKCTSWNLDQYFLRISAHRQRRKQTNATGNIFSLLPRQRNKVDTIVLIYHHHISTEYSCTHNTGWDWVIYGWYFEHGLLRSRWKRRYHKNSFYLGVTELRNFLRFSELRMRSFSFLLSSLGSYWVNIFLWNAL